jgi:DNA-binding winged helix-turn-helix (wHTH) protein
MIANENSNNFQTAAATSYRFSDFEVYPAERLVKRNGQAIALTPKAFDALLCLVRHAEHLVTKRELMAALWPKTHVTEANLTNIIGALRRVLGGDAIRTVSKYGYRLTLSVKGEPGVGQEMYQRFARARELTAHRSLESVTIARELYWICLAENPGFAPLWAWLGRCCWFRGKFSRGSSGDVELADAAFKRAFALDPDLACAHQFYTPVETDTGNARRALVRLRDRLDRHPDEPETLAGLVQVLRFCGLLKQSVEADKRARELDPTILTSVPHSLFLMSEYAATIDAYSGRTGYYLDAAAWAALGNKSYSASLLRERLTLGSLSDLMAGLMRSLLAIVEDRPGDALECMQSMHIAHEPEVLIYLARHYSFIGERDLAMTTLSHATESGLVCAPSTLRSDPWLESVRVHPSFGSLLSTAEKLVDEAKSLHKSGRPSQVPGDS